MFDDEARELGPEMKSEGWIPLYGDALMWLHEPSHRVVMVEGPRPRKDGNYSCMPLPALHGEPADLATPGYLVFCRVHAEGGHPIEGSGFWVESYGEAVRRARMLRKAILAESKGVDPSLQLTFDDLLEAKERR